MKKFNFMLVMVLGIITAISSSCTKEPVIVGSSLENFGVESVVEVNSNTEGSDFTYESWVIVDQVFEGDKKTKSSNSRVTTSANEGGGTKISVMLTNSFRHVSTKVDVEHFHMFDEPLVSIERRGGGISLEESYVTIADSILVYKLDYGCFVESFELFYQVATYDDGITLFNFPHKSYSNFVPDDFIVSNLDAKRESNGWAYAYKSVTQDLNVDFDGRTYQMQSSTILRRVVETKGNPFVVQSEFLENSLEPYEDDVSSSVYFNSNVKMHQVWSDGKNENANCGIDLKYEILNTSWKEFECNGDPNRQNLQRIELNVDEMEKYWSSPNVSLPFGTVPMSGCLHLVYPSWDVVFEIRGEFAFYDDGSTYVPYPIPIITEESIRIVSDEIILIEDSSEPGWYTHFVEIEIEMGGAKMRCKTMNNLHFS